MTGTRISLFVILLVVPSSLIGPSAGCIAFRPAGAGGSELTAPPQHAPSAQQLETADQAVLTAVEEFLERTREYQSATPPPVTTPVPALPSVRTAAVGAGTYRGPADSVPSDEAPLTANHHAFANTEVSLASRSPIVPAPALPVVQRVWIRPAFVGEPPSEPLKTKTTNAPLDTGSVETPRWIDEFLTRFAARVEKTNDFDSEWQLRLAQLVLNRDDEAAQVSSSLPEDAKRMLAALVQVAVAVRRAARDPYSVAEEALQRVETLREVLADRADPTITMIALCRKVVTFGVYEEMSGDDFVAGQSLRTIVYTEIRDFRSERTEDGQYRTRLATRLEVLTADGRSAWQHEEPEITDVCRQRRTDFFIAQRITLPPTLPADDYVLKVMIEDRLSGRASEASHPFGFRSATSVAQGF